MQAFPKYLTKKLKKKIKISWYVSFYTLFVIFKWLTNQIRFKTWCILPNRSHGWAWFGLELQNSDFYRTKSTKFGKFKSLIFSWHLSSSHDVKMENGSKCLENWYSIPIKFLFCFFFSISDNYASSSIHSHFEKSTFHWAHGLAFWFAFFSLCLAYLRFDSWCLALLFAS